ncbi:MAG TPA: hypothetical protein VFP84_01305 [Kofleriaceae bacterium]|nr:hypothetical protein [Kofleriaceae bacterium]
MKADYDAKTRSLMRLAQLLQRRYRSTRERSFVMLMADSRRSRPLITGDAMVTQPLGVFR